MSPFPLLLFLVCAFYAIFGLWVLRQASKASCRACVFRHRCLNRQHGRSRFTESPFCILQNCDAESTLASDQLTLPTS